MAYTQADRLIAIHTPLGEDALLLQGFTGHEGMSRLFSFQLELLSEDSGIAFERIVGQRASIRVLRADGEKRYINGFISRFAQRATDARFTHYQAELVPWLWFLTRTADCRIFQNMTVPDIIKKIFTDLGFNDFRLVLQKQYEPRTYCVQYRETDFNFVSRLMEHNGLFYFFAHEENKHTVVIGDTPSANRPCSGQEQARCEFGDGTYENEDVITAWQVEHEVRPGKYALTDYNFETPSTSLGVNLASKVTSSSNGHYEIYDYPGEYLKKGHGEIVVKTRMEEEEVQHCVVNGSSTCRAFVPGYRFDLTGHKRADMNTAYVLVSVQHTASVGNCYVSSANPDDGEICSNHFSCIPHEVPFRAPRVTPRPIVQGPQTAVVVGPAGEEIYTDKYGRVKVQFHWDREGKRDAQSSCWIRVSHPWAGKGWGAVSIPRIGQEVIIDFLEGDPDQPIITGRVYNAEQMPPYGLPGGAVVSGIKSNSTKGGGGYNEMSFDDTKGKEQVVVHGQYDMHTTVEHDQTTTVHRHRTDAIDVDDKETVGHDQTQSVGNNHMQSVGGNQTLSVVKNRTRTVSQNETVTVTLMRAHSVGINEMINVGAAQEVTVGGFRSLSVGLYQNTTIGASHTEHVGTNHSETIGNNHSETIGNDHSETIGSDRSTKIGSNRQTNIGKDDSLKIGKNLVIDAGSQIVIKTGQASITMKSDGTIVIKGKAITVDAMQKIEEKAMNITSEASAKSMTKGSMVNVEASGINTIKGSLVKIN